MIKFVKSNKVCQVWQRLLKVPKFDEVCQVLSSLLKFTKFIWMLPGMIFGKVCNSLANNNYIKILAAIILTQATLNFQNVYDSWGNNNSFTKNGQNSLRFKQISWESLDGNHEKEGTTTKGPLCAVSFLYKDFHSKLLKCALVPSEIVRSWSTWLNYNYF